MTVHELFTSEHVTLRQLAADLQKTLKGNPAKVEELYVKFQETARNHIHKEEQVYYTEIDSGKQFADRVLMHDLRNDRAAVIFALESLAIKLRKKVPLSEWKPKFDHMLGVLLGHFDQEEKALFPQVEKLLNPAELQALLEKVQALG